MKYLRASRALASAVAATLFWSNTTIHAKPLVGPITLSDITYGASGTTYNGSITNSTGISLTNWKNALTTAYANQLGGIWTFESNQYSPSDVHDSIDNSKSAPLPTTFNFQSGNASPLLTLTTTPIDPVNGATGISRKTGSSTYVTSSGSFSGMIGYDDAHVAPTLTLTIASGQLAQVGFVQLNRQRTSPAFAPTTTWTATFSDNTTQTQSNKMLNASTGGFLYYFAAPAGQTITQLKYTTSDTSYLSPIDDMGFVFAPAISSTTYALSASAAGGGLADGRLTQGQSTTLTATITNSGTGSADTLDFSGLSVGGMAVSPASGSAVANSGGSASGTRAFTATTTGSILLNPSVTTAGNHTLGTTASMDTATAGSILVDALVEHTTFIDAGSSSTASTAAYRRDYVANGNLGVVLVTKEAAGGYLPGYADNLNAGAGIKAGTLTVNVTGAGGSGFAPDPSVFLLDFSSITDASNSGNLLDAGLSALENELAADGYIYVDRFGNTNATLTTTDLDTFRTASRDYDLELLFNPGPTASPSYFDFNFANSNYNSIGSVVNIAVVPEPTGWHVAILATATTLWLSRQRRSTPAQSRES